MQKRRFILSSFLFIFSLSLFASGRDSLTFDIDSFDFKRPEKNVGVAGTFVFNRISLYYADMVTEISNEDGRFNSKIFVRNNFFGLLGTQIKLGMYGKPGDFLTEITESTAKNMKLDLNDKKLSIDSTEFSMKLPYITMGIKGDSTLFCQKHPEAKGNSSSDLERACLNYMSFFPLNKKPGVKTNFTLFPETDDDSYFDFKGLVDYFELNDQKIIFKGRKVNMDLDHDYLLQADAIYFDCAKEQQEVFDGDPMIQRCLHEFSVKPGARIMVENLNDHSSFEFTPEHLLAGDQRLIFQTKKLVMHDSEGPTTLNNLFLNCKFDQDRDATDVGTYIQGCLDNGEITLGDLLTSSSKGSEKIFTDRSKHKKDKAGTLRDVRVVMHNGRIEMNSIVKFLFKFKLSVEGSGYYDKEKSQMVVKIKHARLPMGIHSVKLLTYFLRKLVASETVKVYKKNIVIQF